LKLEFSILNFTTCAPQRLDAYIAQCIPESRMVVKQWFKQKHITALSPETNQRLYPDPSRKIISRLQITIDPYLSKFNRRVQPNPHLEAPILFEDDDLLVINKPRGHNVNALKYTETDTIANFFLAKTPSLWDWDQRFLEPGIVHRLDQWTSGCLIGIKTKHALDHLRLQFQNRTITKIYLALVEGRVDWEETWEDDIIHDPKNMRKMSVVTSRTPTKYVDKARNAILSFRPIKHYPNNTLVEVNLKTGRMHQIRVQFAHRGFPVLGDQLYKAQQLVKFKGYWLHAHHLSFKHPRSEEILYFSASLPEDLQKII
jgi:23S rRNA pseudouridine1911/1915/1917 synthase